MKKQVNMTPPEFIMPHDIEMVKILDKEFRSVN
jgi:hypothetical protein